MNSLALPHWRRDRLTHAVIAETTWGFAVAAGLTAMELARCGAACIDQTAITTAACVAFGIVCVGPLATLRRDDAAT
jgi:hypothetical protein